MGKFERSLFSEISLENFFKKHPPAYTLIYMQKHIHMHNTALGEENLLSEYFSAKKH